MKAEGNYKYSSTLSLTSALDGVGGQHHTPTALPLGRTRYPLYRRLGGPQSRCGQVRKISPSPGFDPRTVQPVASRYTDCAIPAPPNTSVTGHKHGTVSCSQRKHLPISNANSLGVSASQKINSGVH
jgi:hypothetical protein